MVIGQKGYISKRDVELISYLEGEGERRAELKKKILSCTKIKRT